MLTYLYLHCNSFLNILKKNSYLNLIKSSGYLRSLFRILCADVHSELQRLGYLIQTTQELGFVIF